MNGFQFTAVVASCLSAPAWACDVDLTMKVVGFDKANERAVVRVEAKGSVETIDLKVFDLRTGKETRDSVVIVDRDDPPAQRQKLRGKRWKDAQAALEKAGFTLNPTFPAASAKGVTLGDLSLTFEAAADEGTGFSGNQLVARVGANTRTLDTLMGPPGDAPRLADLYTSPDQRWVLVTEAGCVNGALRVYEVASLRVKVSSAKQP